MSQAFTLFLSPSGVAELKFDIPGEKVNTFSLPVLDELEQHLDKLASNSSIKVLKLTSGKENSFIAGANLHSFEPLFKNPSLANNIIQAGHRVFQKLSDLPFPTVAVINGICLGGGTECALSCTYRVITDHPKTQIGLPEVTLGIFPGWGGTQRLPRLVGLAEGLGMILSGKAVSGVKAWKIGLADKLAAAEFLNETVDQFVASILSEKGAKAVQNKRETKGFVRILQEDNPIGRSLVFYLAKKNVLEKTKGHYPAPLMALDLIERTYTLPLKEGLKEEASAFLQDVPDRFKQAVFLIQLFFTQEALKKETGAPPGTKVKDIHSAAVLGAGIMGSSLAWLLADHNIFTRLKDLSWDLIGKGLAAIKEQFTKGLKAKKLTPCEYDRRIQLISGTTDFSGFSHADIVIEAATENLELKRKIFQELEKHVRPDTIIATNTSSLTIDSMASSFQHPERFVGMHFFNPVAKMPLVEVVAGKNTSKETLATAMDFCRKLGKSPMIVGDCAGFLVNRIFIMGANEMLRMYAEGYAATALEKEILNFGMPMGPFELADEVGIDVIYKVSEIFEKAYGERMKPAPLLQLMAEQGLYGKKNNSGFYLYKNKTRLFNPTVHTLLASLQKEKKTLSEKEILPRFLYGVINEASRCLEENIVTRPDFLDLALIMGTGFPPFQGGLLRYADRVGIPHIVETLKQFSQNLGMRFTPSPLLIQMAKDNKKFYPDSP